jgi:hypothetical protein
MRVAALWVFIMSNIVEVEKRFFKQHKGKPYFAIVAVRITVGADGPQIVVNCSGWGWQGQGDLDDVTEYGYEDWKQAAVVGAKYALGQANRLDCATTITKIVGRALMETNPSIITVVTVFAVWQALSYEATDLERNKLEEIMFNSWNLPLQTIPVL